MRETVADFYASRYARCLAALERWRPALQLDAGLARHLPALVAAIRERALLQYATPFSSVDLAAMAAAFNTSIGRVALTPATSVARCNHDIVACLVGAGSPWQYDARTAWI